MLSRLRKVLSFILMLSILSGLICFVNPTVANAAVSASPEGDMLRFQVNNTATTPHYYYQKFSTAAYTFSSGDYLEYDVYLNDNTAGFGGVEVVATDGTYCRDQSTFIDQNGLSGHPGTNITAYAYGTWYHRQLPIPANMIGKTSNEWDLASEATTNSVSLSALYDNVVITTANGSVKKVIFKYQADSNVNTQGTWASNATGSMLYLNYDPKPTGDILRFDVVNTSAGTHYYYRRFSNSSYVFQTGDYLEYDVKIYGSEFHNNAPLIAGAGGVELVTSDGYYCRDYATFKDQNNISGHPASDLTGYANNQWYHRKIPIPSALIGKTLNDWDVAGEYATSSKTYSALYDNIVITNGLGTERKVGFKSAADITANVPGNWVSNASALLYTTAYSLPAVIDNTTNPTGDVIKLDFSTNSYYSTGYYYRKFSTAAYTFQAGDYLEFDVKGDPSIAAVEIVATDGSYCRDQGSFLDQNGIPGHPASYVCYAEDQWYHRKLPIPSNMIGKTANEWDVCAQSGAVKSYSLFDNILITDGNGVVRKVAFRDAADSNCNTQGTWASSGVTCSFTIKPLWNFTMNDDKPTGDVIRLNVTNNATTPHYYYSKFSTSSYVFQTGDYLEYDVMLLNNSAGIGGVDLVATDGSFCRDSAGFTDQNGVSGHPGTDLTAYAFAKWYHRKLPVPGNMIGKTCNEWDVAIQNGTNSVTLAALYDNICITDSTGAERKVGFKSAADSNCNTAGSFVSNATATMAVSGIGTLAASNPRIFSPVNAQQDLLVADYNVTEAPYSADSTGTNDATNAIQSAIFDAYLNGGGAVYIPAGKYKVTSTIYVMPYVTIRGDWKDPDTYVSGSSYGTVILAQVASSASDYPGLFRIAGAAGVEGLTIYYPNQSATAPVAYPYTFEIPGQAWSAPLNGVNNVNPANITAASVVNCTMINSYKGIGISVTPNDLGTNDKAGTVHEYSTIKNVKGTVLYRGVDARNGADVSVWSKVKLSNAYWVAAGTDSSGYNYSSPARATIDTWTRANGIGFRLADLEWDQFIETECSYYNRGIYITGGPRAQFTGVFFNANVTNCNTAILIDDIDTRWGVGFLRSTISGSTNSIVNSTAGYIKLTDCTITGATSGSNIQISNPGTSALIYPWKASLPKPPNNNFYLVTADKTGVTDATSTIQTALTNAGTAGGGTVYLPAGYYKISTHLTVPANVELRGASAIRFRQTNNFSGGTVLCGYEGKDTATPDTDTAMITLNGTNAGINGIVIWLPNNDPRNNNWVGYKYPYNIRGNGTGVYVKNMFLANAYNGIDFKTNTCNNHYISGINMTAFNKSIVIGASTEGWIEDVLQNPCSTARNGFPNWFQEVGLNTWNLLCMTHYNTTLITVDGASNEHLLNVFAYGVQTLLHVKSGATVGAFNVADDNLDPKGYGFRVDSGTVTVYNYQRYNGSTMTLLGNPTIYNEMHLY